MLYMATWGSPCSEAKGGQAGTVPYKMMSELCSNSVKENSEETMNWLSTRGEWSPVLCAVSSFCVIEKAPHIFSKVP